MADFFSLRTMRKITCAPGILVDHAMVYRWVIKRVLWAEKALGKYTYSVEIR